MHAPDKAESLYSLALLWSLSAGICNIWFPQTPIVKYCHAICTFIALSLRKPRFASLVQPKVSASSTSIRCLTVTWCYHRSFILSVIAYLMSQSWPQHSPTVLCFEACHRWIGSICQVGSATQTRLKYYGRFQPFISEQGCSVVMETLVDIKFVAQLQCGWSLRGSFMAQNRKVVPFFHPRQSLQPPCDGGSVNTILFVFLFLVSITLWGL